jgi:hypothetical protein
MVFIDLPQLPHTNAAWWHFRDGGILKPGEIFSSPATFLVLLTMFS